ncbi:endonuclease/exonuclease/phosphatase family protein, partial [Leucobacter sp. M11]|uniref:endonuclease/exonuclease/phosphatase family protein n=1 Tax=Leucobacter sp. M11 TaxID=2993565 RepID=UPI002D7F4F3A
MARFFGSLILLALVVAAVIAVWPQLLGLEHTEPFAQLVAMRGLSVAVAALLIVFLLILSLVIRPWRGFLGRVCVILLLFALANVAILIWRGVGNAPLPPAGSGDVTVLSWNTFGDEVPADRIIALAQEQGAQIVVLPETTDDLADRVAAGLSQQSGSSYVAHTAATDEVYRYRSTSVVVAAELGEYRLDAAAGADGVIPSVVLRPAADSGSPTVIGVHSMAPVPGEMSSWREHMNWLRGACEIPNAIIAGDVNATPDHLTEVPGCEIAAVTARNAGVGTWHTMLPALAGAPIDQVFSTEGWRAAGFHVITSEGAAGSDHRPVVARL